MMVMVLLGGVSVSFKDASTSRRQEPSYEPQLLHSENIKIHVFEFQVQFWKPY